LALPIENIAMAVRIKNAVHDIAYIDCTNPLFDHSRRMMDCLVKAADFLTSEDRHAMDCLNTYRQLQIPLRTRPFHYQDGKKKSTDDNDALLRFVPASPMAEKWKNVTTVMVQNIPKRITQDQFLQHLLALGFAGTYDCLCVPLDHETKYNFGYAILNFLKPGYAWKYKHCVRGLSTVSTDASGGKRLKVRPVATKGLEEIFADQSGKAPIATVRWGRHKRNSQSLPTSRFHVGDVLIM
jgi:hypothetical protein